MEDPLIDQRRDQLPAIFIMGPTASGKTDLAVKLAQEYPLDIISVDSAMAYRGMDIGTAKPDAETLALAPHRLIDICDPVEPYSAAQFCEDALREMKHITDRGRIPLLVGGTFLYFRALAEGLSPLPSANEAIREKLNQQASEIGWDKMHEQLAKIDPQSATRIHPNDPQRIQRALEVYEASGKNISQWYAEENHHDFPYTVTKIAVATQNRPELHERIAKRLKNMLNQGLIEEVEALHQRSDLHPDLPLIRAVGYRQVWEYLDGKVNRETMEEKALAATRRFAKRQFTWLRSEADSAWLEATLPDIYNEVLKKLVVSSIL